MDNNYQMNVVHLNRHPDGSLDHYSGSVKAYSGQLIPARMHHLHTVSFPTFKLSLPAPSADRVFHIHSTVQNTYVNRQKNSLLNAYSNDILLFNLYSEQKKEVNDIKMTKKTLQNIPVQNEITA